MTQQENQFNAPFAEEEAAIEQQQAPHRRAQRASHTEAVTQGAVRYLDTEALARPLDMPSGMKRGLIAALAAGCVVGAIMLFNYFDAVVNGPAREQASLEQNIAKEVSYDLPAIGTLMNLGDADIMSAISVNGAQFYEKIPAGTEGGFEVIKLADGVSLADAGLMYVQGIDNLSGADAARLLNGSWDMTIDRKSGVDIRVRYADFTSGTLEQAIQKAMEAEGLTVDNITDSGIDDAGNTYSAGTINIDGAEYSWRASALKLSKVYNVKGFPENAAYVGVRFIA